MANIFKQVSDQRHAVLVDRYEKFQKGLDVTDCDPIKVFDPLSKKQLDELELIREVSKDLQKKKEEDLNKAAQAAKQAEADAKTEAEDDAAKEQKAEEAKE